MINQRVKGDCGLPQTIKNWGRKNRKKKREMQAKEKGKRICWFK
jgi:hypothetical protein